MCDPLLLLDVDGVISLFGFDVDAPPPGQWELVEGIPHLISATAGEHLRALASAYELVWCTGWEEKASEHLPRVLGLELRTAMAHLSFERSPGRANAHWKLAAIDTFAGPERPLAWIDDALDERCEAWAEAREGPTLLVATEPAAGMTDEHVETLLAWAESVAPEASA